MGRLKTTARSNEGAALILVIGYLAVVTFLASTFLAAFHQAMDASTRAERHQVCLAIAEGGIEKAIAGLRANGQAYAGEKNTPLGDGFFTVEVRPDDGRREYRIVSTARLESDPVTLATARIAADIAFDGDGSVRRLHWEEVKRW